MASYLSANAGTGSQDQTSAAERQMQQQALSELLSVLLSAGYFRARVSALNAFDKVRDSTDSVKYAAFVRSSLASALLNAYAACVRVRLVLRALLNSPRCTALFAFCAGGGRPVLVHC